MSETIIAKTCSKCKIPKTLSEFAPRNDRPCAYQSHCRECQRLYSATPRGQENIRRALIRFNNSDHGKIRRKEYRQTKAGKHSAIISGAKQRIKYPNKASARCAIGNAIKQGYIPSPTTLKCHYCPKQAEQYHHWHGYAKEYWLDVVPACRKCHIHIHRVVRIGKMARIVNGIGASD